MAIIFGKITIEADVTDNQSGVKKVEFYVDDAIKSIDNYLPYEWLWDEFAFGRHEIKVIAYGNEGNNAKDKMDVIIFNIG